MILKVFSFLNVIIFLNAADMTKAHQEGAALANAQKGTVSNQAASINKSDVPGYQTDQPSEMHLDQNNLKETAENKKQGDEAANYIQKNSSDPNRKKYDIASEDLLLNAERATEDPLKTMNEIVMEEQGSDTSTDELFECEESGSHYQATCSKRLEIDLKVDHYEEKHHRCTQRNHSDDDPSCGAKQYYTISKKKVEKIREEWVDDCGPLEKLSESGFCAYGTKEIGGQETRTIQGEPVTRPSWFERYTYICKKQPSVSCDALKAKRCQQVDSKCLELINGVCVLWRYIYKCSSTNTQKMKTYKSGGGSPFCFTGNCADTSYPVNSDMMDAFSQMAILKQVQEDNKNNIGIFKGDVRHCSKNCLDFKDCCGGNGGWGVDIGLSSCSEDEKLLSQLRQKNLCVELGEYCAEKIDLGFTEVCLRKKRGHCCFGSKLSKTIQEQGRRQLGLDFGSAEHPNCRALTADELSRLDFSKMDLTPLYDDISQKMKTPDQGHMAKGIELDRIRDNMKLLTSNQTRKNS